MSHYCLIHKTNPEQVFANLFLLRDYQRTLIETGMPIYWFNDVMPEHTAFAAAQYLAVADIMQGNDNTLHFYPDKPITHGQVAYALARIFSLSKNAIHNQASKQINTVNNNPNNSIASTITDNDAQVQEAIKACLTCGLFIAQGQEKFDSDKPLNTADLKTIAGHKLFRHIEAANTLTSLDAAQDGSLTRAQFAIWLYTIVQSKNLFGKQ